MKLNPFLTIAHPVCNIFLLFSLVSATVVPVLIAQDQAIACTTSEPPQPTKKGGNGK